jgi:hypothetical protein
MSIFSHFRYVRELEVERLRLQDMLNSERGERERLWERLDQSTQEARQCYQMLVNFSMQKNFGTTPFPDAPRLPSHIMPPAKDDDGGPVEVPYVHGSTLVARGTADFRREAMDRFRPGDRS